MNKFGNFLLPGEMLEFGRLIELYKRGYNLIVNELQKPELPDSQDGWIDVNLYIPARVGAVSHLDFYMRVKKCEVESLWISPYWRNPSNLCFYLKNCNPGTYTIEIAETIDILNKQYEDEPIQQYYLEDEKIIESLDVIGCATVKLDCKKSECLIKQPEPLPAPVEAKQAKTAEIVKQVEVKTRIQSINLFPLAFWFSSFSLLYDLIASKLLYVLVNISIDSIYLLIHIILMIIFNSVLVLAIKK